MNNNLVFAKAIIEIMEIIRGLSGDEIYLQMEGELDEIIEKYEE